MFQPICTNVVNKHAPNKKKTRLIKPSHIYQYQTKSRYYVAVKIARAISENNCSLKKKGYINSKETLVISCGIGKNSILKTLS